MTNIAFLNHRPRPNDVFIAVMGMTGSGKSTFISLCSEEEVPIGHTLQACTKEVGVYRYQWTDDVDVYLVDTPGFDDTNRQDSDVLKDIASWLTASYLENVKLSGILYLHRITEPRMVGSAKKNLFLFKSLCGNQALGNVLLVSTMWESIALDEGVDREHELMKTEDFWGVLIDHGAGTGRHNNTQSSALDLLRKLVKKKPTTMSIQREMVDNGKPLDETAAGMELAMDMLRGSEKLKEELAETRELLNRALESRDHEAAKLLQQTEEETRSKIDSLIQEREALRVSMEKMHSEKWAKMEESLRKLSEDNAREKRRHDKQERRMAGNVERLRRSQEEVEGLQEEVEGLQKDVADLRRANNEVGISQMMSSFPVGYCVHGHHRRHFH